MSSKDASQYFVLAGRVCGIVVEAGVLPVVFGRAAVPTGRVLRAASSKFFTSPTDREFCIRRKGNHLFRFMQELLVWDWRRVMGGRCEYWIMNGRLLIEFMVQKTLLCTHSG